MISLKVEQNSVDRPWNWSARVAKRSHHLAGAIIMMMMIMMIMMMTNIPVAQLIFLWLKNIHVVEKYFCGWKFSSNIETDNRTTSDPLDKNWQPIFQHVHNIFNPPLLAIKLKTECSVNIALFSEPSAPHNVKFWQNSITVWNLGNISQEFVSSPDINFSKYCLNEQILVPFEPFHIPERSHISRASW